MKIQYYLLHKKWLNFERIYRLLEPIQTKDIINTPPSQKKKRTTKKTHQTAKPTNLLPRASQPTVSCSSCMTIKTFCTPEGVVWGGAVCFE